MIGVLNGLYAITRPSSTLVADVAAALRGGARVVQYRDKSYDAERRLFEARQLKTLCAASEVTFIVNDDLMLAQTVHADGVHIGRNDRSIADARAVLGPRAVIGVSCYDEIERASAAAKAGADYLAFGSFFPSPTKPAAPRATLELLAQASDEFELPLCAVGGVTPENGGPLVRGGASMLAAITGVFDSPDIEAAAAAYARLFR
ncbi:MAG: thiamine phosphate synthase [Gammaproteobacteria bacterium]